MPSSLRKACRECSRAKRRCHPQLPKCPRCQKTGTACVYELEPLPCTQPVRQGVITATSDDYILYGQGSPNPYYLFDSLASAHRAATRVLGVHLTPSTRPEIRYLVDPDMMQLATSYYREIIHLKAQHQSSPFVHVQLYHNRPESLTRIKAALSLHGHLSTDTADELEQLSPSRNPFFRRLAKEVLIARPLTDMLLLIDELILYLIIYSMGGGPLYYRVESEQYIELLSESSARLWSALPSDLDDHLSPWHAWLTAESARRTILASRMISIALHARIDNYVVYSDFIETLPFDPRSGLWEATSEEAWQVAKMQHRDVSTVLVSFHEFVNGYDDRPDWHGEGLFQKTLLMGSSAKDSLIASP